MAMSGNPIATPAGTPPKPPGESRRLRVLYTGSDERIVSLLEKIQFVAVARAAPSPDGRCPVLGPDRALLYDAVIVDHQPDDAHPVLVVESIKAQASRLPVLLLSQPDLQAVELAALDLGVETVSRSGAYQRRLVGALTRLHGQFALFAQQRALADREARLRRIVETLPQGIAVISESFSILAVNGVALELFGASTPIDVVGRNLTALVVPERRDDVVRALSEIVRGEQTTVRCDLVDARQNRRAVELSGVALGRDATGRHGLALVFREPSAALPDTADLDALAAELAASERRRAELETERETAARSSAATVHDLQAKLTAALMGRRDAESALARCRDAESALGHILTQERAAWEEIRTTQANALGHLQDELGRVRRLGEAGSLVTEVAPELDSLLRQLATTAADVQRSLASDDPRRAHAETLVSDVTEAAAIVRWLTVFCQRQARPLISADLNDAIRERETTLRQLAGPDIELELELGGTGSVAQHDGDLDRLLTALVVAARDVLPIGGALTMRTGLVEDVRANGGGADGQPAAHAVLEVAARGLRTATAHVPAPVDGLVRALGGSIGVEKQTARSTVIRVHLPLA